MSGSWEVAVSLSDIRSDDPEFAEPLRNEEREPEAGGLKSLLEAEGAPRSRR